MVSEAMLEREVLAAVGRIPDLSLFKNEVGQGFTGSVEDELMQALAKMRLTGRELATVRAVLNRHRIRWGLGEGSPDLVGALAGRAIGLELKSDRGVVSEEQKRWHAAARKKGVAVFVVRDPMEAVEMIDRARRGALE